MSALFNDEEVHTIIVLPPDGGWGLVVVFGSFICHFVIDGTIYTFGLFLQTLHEAFDTSIAQTCFIGALLNGVCYFMGPFASACLNRFDFRFVAVVGCIIASIGYAISSYSVNYVMFLVGHGVVLGIGYGILYVPALISPSIYFAKYRAIAVSFATCGTGLGTFAVPYFITLMLEEVGWRMTYLAMIGLVAIAALASLTFIPLESTQITTARQQNKSYGTSQLNFRRDKRRWCTCCHWGNKYFPTTNQVVESQDVYLQRLPTRASVYSMSRNQQSVLNRGRFLSTVSFANVSMNMWWYNFKSCLCCECFATDVRALYRDDLFYAGELGQLQENQEKAYRLKMRIKRKKQRREMREKRKKEEAAAQKKRADEASTSIDYDEDEVLSPEEIDRRNRNYHMRVTRVTTDRELLDETKFCECHVASLRALTSMLDFGIFKSIAFIILMFNGFFFTLGYMIPFMYIAERAVESGIDKANAVSYIAFIGVSNVAGRVFSGILPLIINVNPLVLICIFSYGQGIFTACSGLLMENWFQVTYACSYGFLAAPAMALRTVMVAEIFGLANLTNIFGLQLVASGIAAMLGPTLAGYLRDKTESYTISFYFSGGSIVFSTFLLMFIRMVRNWETRKDSGQT